MPQVTLTVNGRSWTGEVHAEATLLDVLRHDLQLTGPKLGCGEAQCGSCTVLLDGRPVNACVTPVTVAGNRAVVTVEGLATGDRLHPVQQAFVDKQAFQCGYCTPGMVTAAVALLTSNPAATDDEIRRALDGHLCRCGVYPRIVEAVRAAGAAMAREAGRG
jgi:aerobic-type carbon monoxide dehydrogenase small subunit (CoxS/CutS family)